AELAKFEQQIAEERKQREKDLQAKKELVKQKMESTDKLDWKRFQLDDQNTDLNLNADATKDHYDEQKEKTMAEYEETMRLIKEATGVSIINEVIAKFQSQGDTHKHLSQLQQANEARIEDLKRKKQHVLAQFEELRFSGESKHSHSQRMIEEFQEHLREGQRSMMEAKLKYERVAKLLVNAKAGIQHLFDKVEGVPLPDRTLPGKMSDDNVLEYLDICLQKFDSLANSVQGKELPEQPTVTTPAAPQPAGETTSILQVSQSTLPPYNTRVKLRPVEFEESVLEGAVSPYNVITFLARSDLCGFADDEENDDEYGEVPDRETIKKHTAQMLNARLKAKQPKKVKKKKAAKDEDSS
ncbi:hypothetical protein HK104_007197, partial [Borealophlyctis nickersoniae]